MSPKYLPHLTLKCLWHSKYAKCTPIPIATWNDRYWQILENKQKYLEYIYISMIIIMLHLLKSLLLLKANILVTLTSKLTFLRHPVFVDGAHGFILCQIHMHICSFINQIWVFASILEIIPMFCLCQGRRQRYLW